MQALDSHLEKSSIQTLVADVVVSNHLNENGTVNYQRVLQTLSRLFRETVHLAPQLTHTYVNEATIDVSQDPTHSVMNAILSCFEYYMGEQENDVVS